MTKAALAGCLRFSTEMNWSQVSELPFLVGDVLCTLLVLGVEGPLKQGY